MRDAPTSRSPAMHYAAPGSTKRARAGYLTAADLLSDSPIPAAKTAEDVDDRDALVLFTSGTTGLPKAIGITSGQLSARIRGIGDNRSAPDVGAHRGDDVRPVLPCRRRHLACSAACTRATPPWCRSGSTPHEWLRLVQEHRVRTAFLVPTMLQRILDHPDFADTDLTSLIAIAYGAAAAPVALVRRAMAALPHVAFANVFGQTETLGAYTTLMPDDHRDPNRVGSVGRPLPGVEVRVVDPDTGTDVEAGEVGELWVNTSQNVTEGWLHTGDLARRDADGYIYPSGRLNDTINRGGEKFGPIEVEEALRTHPAVSDVAVAGIADEEMGQRVGAAVVAGSPVTLDELRSHCRELHRLLQAARAADDRRRHPVQRHRQGQPPSARRADRGERLSHREESPCCSFTRPTGSSAPARTTSRRPTARAGCPRWRRRTTLGCSGTPTTLTAPGWPTTWSPSPASPTARRGRRLARRAQTRRPGAVDARTGQPASRRHRQDPAAGRVVAPARGRPRRPCPPTARRIR